MKPRIVIDTNVFVTALRSRRGASFKLLTLLGKDKFVISVSVPLVIEYEGAAKRISRSLGLNYSDIDDILDYLCSVSEHRKVHFLWRPFLNDPNDDMVLELAVESQSDYILTYNVKDFQGSEEFGVKVITPKDFLKMTGVL
ncbi:MAG: putative toxin-antitoxin system toxin component, PIN family [Candidatus Latescibacteria bacterium]|nr:putative toxin-antitoxin system toxin component, PIN family [Candidatus Latescibacterota bacterium]